MQGVAQRFDATQPAMSFGIHATVIEDRRGSSQCLQAVGIEVSLTIIPNLRKPPGSQVLPRTRQTFKEGVILMGQKKGADLFVIVGNLFHEWQQLAHQGQHQARFGACEDHIGLQLRVVQQFDNRSRSIGWMGMPGVFELLLKLVERSGSCCLKGWIGLQEQQRTLLLQLREQLQGHGIIRYASSRELLDQTGLRADQRIWVTCQLFELRHLVTIWSQPTQIREIGTPGLGQQIGINQISFGSRGRAATVNRSRVDWINRPTCFQKVDNQQAMCCFNNKRHLLFGCRTNDLHQKYVQLGKSLWSVINTDRTYLMPFAQQSSGHRGARPPSQSRYTTSETLLSAQNVPEFTCPSTVALEARLSHDRSGSGTMPGKCELSQSVEPGGARRLSPLAFNSCTEHV